MKSVLPTPRETTLEGLEKFTDYTIRVFAFTSKGNGVPSQPVLLRTQEDGKLSVASCCLKGPWHENFANFWSDLCLHH